MIKIKQLTNPRVKSSSQEIPFDNQSQYLNLSHHIHLHLQLNALSSYNNLKALILNCNQLKHLPKLPQTLSYLDASHNSLTSIPKQLLDIPNLSVLKLNFNKIKALKNVPNNLEQLKMRDNPILYIQTSICNKNLKSLCFDWMPYLYFKNQYRTQEQITKQFIKILTTFGCNQQTNFTNFIKMVWSSKTLENLAGVIVYAIDKKHYQFFQFVSSIDCFIDCSAKYTDIIDSQQSSQDSKVQKRLNEKLLFQFALRNDNQIVRNYFLKCSYSMEIKNQHLKLVCTYGNWDYFSHLVYLGYDIFSVDEKGNNLYHYIFNNFNQGNQQILIYMLQNNPKYINKLNYRGLSALLDSAYTNINNTIKLFIWLKGNTNYITFFDFDTPRGEVYKQNILHLATRCQNYSLVKLITELKLVNPFVSDCINKFPKDLTQSEIIKKHLTKYEKNFFENINKKLSKTIHSRHNTQFQQEISTKSSMVNQQNRAQRIKYFSNKKQSMVQSVIYLKPKKIKESIIISNDDNAQGVLGIDQGIRFINQSGQNNMFSTKKHMEQTRVSTRLQTDTSVFTI